MSKRTTMSLPVSGVHDLTCAWLCQAPRPTCTHACRVCEAANQRRRGYHAMMTGDAWYELWIAIERRGRTWSMLKVVP